MLVIQILHSTTVVLSENYIKKQYCFCWIQGDKAHKRWCKCHYRLKRLLLDVVPCNALEMVVRRTAVIWEHPCFIHIIYIPISPCCFFLLKTIPIKPCNTIQVNMLNYLFTLYLCSIGYAREWNFKWEVYHYTWSWTKVMCIHNDVILCKSNFILGRRNYVSWITLS